MIGVLGQPYEVGSSASSLFYVQETGDLGSGTGPGPQRLRGGGEASDPVLSAHRLAVDSSSAAAVRHCLAWHGVRVSRPLLLCFLLLGSRSEITPL